MKHKKEKVAEAEAAEAEAEVEQKQRGASADIFNPLLENCVAGTSTSLEAFVAKSSQPSMSAAANTCSHRLLQWHSRQIAWSQMRLGGQKESFHEKPLESFVVAKHSRVVMSSTGRHALASQSHQLRDGWARMGATAPDGLLSHLRFGLVVGARPQPTPTTEPKRRWARSSFLGYQRAAGTMQMQKVPSAVLHTHRWI